MPITPFLDGHKFDPETKHVLGVVFEMVRAALRLNDRNDLAVEIIAKRIIDLAKEGERNPDLLCERALRDLRASSPHVYV
jgi:hypothetical protein